jgi:mRNA-degrading endonuclease RelE of RelBE toxin-antitoxin system
MRKVLLSKQVAKDINNFDGRELQWICAIVRFLENEENSLETIKQKFKSLNNDLKGYYKAKHRGFKIRMVFKILNAHEIEIYVEKMKADPMFDEIIQLIAVGKRDSIYELASKRARQKDRD